VNAANEESMLSRRGYLFGLIGAAISLERCARTSVSAPHSEPIAGSAHPLALADDDVIRDLLKRRVDVEKRSIGMAVCVVAPQQTRVVTWGRERSSDDRPISSDTVFEIGSITKVFTALLLANMTRSGEVALEDPVTRHLPGDFRVPELNGRPVTLADLATHTSGLPRWPPIPGQRLSPEWREAVARFSLADFKAWLADVGPAPEAQGGWWYSNAGYVLISLALAHRGDQSFETLLHGRILEPTGLTDTRLNPTEAMLSRLAGGHDTSLNAMPPSKLGLLGAGSGDLLSTPRDLARVAAAMLPGSGARIEPDAKALLAVRRPAGRWFAGAQALGVEERDAPGGTFLNKDGVTWGQAASLAYEPEKRVAIAVFSNAHPDLDYATLSGGGVGSADLAQHLLIPQIPLGGQDRTFY
jgi:CubicO group peptidase (beta-lactamase class C family)